MTHPKHVYIRMFPGYPWTVCKLMNNSSNLRHINFSLGNKCEKCASYIQSNVVIVCFCLPRHFCTGKYGVCMLGINKHHATDGKCLAFKTCVCHTCLDLILALFVRIQFLLIYISKCCFCMTYSLVSAKWENLLEPEVI
jgi:hypothetical protein